MKQEEIPAAISESGNEMRSIFDFDKIIESRFGKQTTAPVTTTANANQ